MKYGFGVDLGGTTVKIAFFDEQGRLHDKWEIPTVTENGGSQILQDIGDSVNGYLEQNKIAKESILGIGIGVPGPVDDLGTVNQCHNLNLGVFNIHDALGNLTGIPIKAGNDANVAALGEAWKGGAVGCRNMVLATFGTGVGGGIVVNGQPINGVHGAAGEIGHICVNREEKEPCTCGNYGCAEQYCSATGVVRLAQKHLAAWHGESLLQKHEMITCKDVFDAANEKDTLAEQVLEQVYDYMGQFLAAVCCVTDPEVIVLGGGVSKAGMPLLEGAKRYFDKYVFHTGRSIRFALAKLGNDAGAYGAFKLILDEQA